MGIPSNGGTKEAKVIPDGTARKRFNDNKARFVEDEDYIVRNTDEAKKEYNIIAPNGLVLIAEQGYLWTKRGAIPKMETL